MATRAEHRKVWNESKLAGAALPFKTSGKDLTQGQRRADPPIVA
jgi:hypothetical protein